jgi:hypothetical protein
LPLAAIVESPEPLGKFGDLAIRPHPCWPALEGVDHLFSTAAGLGIRFHVAVHAIAVGPVAFDGDEREAVLFDQSSRECRSPRVELGSPVAGFAEEDVSRLADVVDERVEVVCVPESKSLLLNALGNGGAASV